MERKSSAVKKPIKQQRRYDSSRRREQARRTRDAILDVARRRFLDDGFAATTIAAIADEVGVSVDTIYKGFGGKPGLVRAIFQQALAGDGAVHAEERSDALQTSEPDPHAIMRGIGALTAEVAPRAAPVMLLVRDAALTDLEMASLKTELDDQRLERMTHNARNLAEGGHLRGDLPIEQAGEIMWAYSSPELYELLVVVRGWSLDQFGAFIAGALSAALLPPAS
jgi:AcrR family transcriptional regulator